MKKIIQIFIYCFCISLSFNMHIHAQDFITKWDLSIAGSGATQLTIGVGTTGTCNYYWETIPAGATGTGTFSGNTLTITGFPANAMIRLKIDSSNFNRINIDNGIDKDRLIDVEEWGDGTWGTMQNAFRGCSNLNCTATDLPDLTLVTDMSYMFAGCTVLNGPANINNWNTGSVTNMSNMFEYAANFNQPLGNWNTANVTNMSYMFRYSLFNQAIGNWNTGNVTNISYMFAHASVFNQAIGNWNIGNVTNMNHLFDEATAFNQPIGSWNTANAVYMYYMFHKATTFNRPIGSWNTGNVVDMGGMFSDANNFNQPIGNWNTANVVYMYYMFRNATVFNQAIGNWITGNVTNMSSMFQYAHAFNQPINNWNTANVTNMRYMFQDALSFNRPLGNWNTGSVIYMQLMFRDATSFNQPIGNWNTSNVTSMDGMFQHAVSFNQPIDSWYTGNVNHMSGMFRDATSFNQPIGNWNTGNVTNMGGMFDGAIAFNQPIGNWNTVNVTTMNSMFYGATSFNQAIGNWNTGNVTDMSRMFRNATSFNQPIDNWNTGNVSTMTYMFNHADLFNQPIDSWNVSNVWDMGDMFNNATSFNQAIASWQLNVYAFMANMLDNSGMDCYNYSSTLIGWSNNLNIPSNRILWALNIEYSPSAQNARNYLINTKGWTINGDALDMNCCVQQYVTLNDTGCVSYFFNGQTLTNIGTYYDTLIDMYGCDSIITLNLTIYPGTASTTNASICFSQTPYNWNGQNLNSPGTYIDTFVNANGCDSIATLILNISLCGQCQPNFTVNWTPFVDSLVESQTWINTSGTVLIPVGAKVKFDANVGGYVRLNPGFKAEYGSVFVAQAYNGCTAGAPQLPQPQTGKVLKEDPLASNEIILYPNPTSGMIHIKHDEKLSNIQIFDMVGKLVINQKCAGETETNIDLSHLPNGGYHVKAAGYNSIKVIKNN